MISYKQEEQVFKLLEEMEAYPVNGDVAFVTLMQICRDFVNPHFMPLLANERRVEWLAERLKKFKIKFYEKI